MVCGNTKHSIISVRQEYNCLPIVHSKTTRRNYAANQCVLSFSDIQLDRKPFVLPRHSLKIQGFAYENLQLIQQFVRASLSFILCMVSQSKTNMKKCTFDFYLFSLYLRISRTDRILYPCLLTQEPLPPHPKYCTCKANGSLKKLTVHAILCDFQVSLR